MKLALIFVTICGLSLASPLVPVPKNEACGLKQLLDKYNALVDADEIIEFVFRKIEEGDPNFFAFVEYLFGDDAEAITDYLWENQTYANFIRFLYENGLTDIYNQINVLHSLLGWRPVPPPNKKRSIIDLKSFGDLIEELLELIPVDQLVNFTLALYAQGDPALHCFYDKLKEPAMAGLWQELKLIAPIERLFKILKENEIDIDALVALIESIFNWKRESQTLRLYKFDLQPAFQKIVGIIQLDQFKLYLQQFQGTACGQQALSYIRGPAFDRLVKDFYAEKGFKTVLSWTQANGLERLYEFIAEVHEQLGIAEPPFPRLILEGRRNCSLEDWTKVRNELASYIPQDQMTDVSYELISNDESVQELLKILASNQVEASYLHLKKQQSYKTFLVKLRGTGFEIDKVIVLIEALLGWDNRPKTLP